MSPHDADAGEPAELIEVFTPPADIEEAPPAPTTLFRDGTDEMGLPNVISPTVSIGDVDGDGWPDLLAGGRSGVPDSATELYLNPGGQGFVAADLAAHITSGPAPLADVVSTSIVDLNLDGRPELLLGGFEQARLQVLFQRDGDTWESVILYESDQHPGAKLSTIEVGDFNNNGLLDIYLVIRWPEMMLHAWHKTHPNVLLLATGVEQWGALNGVDAFVPCGSRQAYSAQLVPRGVWGRPALLAVANDMTQNCLWEVTPSLPTPGFTAVDEAEVMADANYSMGVDWTYAGSDGDVLLATSEIGYHLMYTIGDGEIVDESQRLEWAPKDYVGWGIGFIDADNDGDDDLIVANGRLVTSDKHVAFSSQLSPLQIPAYVSKLLYWEQDDEGDFGLATELAGEHFAEETGHWAGVAIADLNRDGCLDVVVSLKDIIDRVYGTSLKPDDWTYEADAFVFHDGPGVRVLLNNCLVPSNRWVAFEVPDRPGYTVRITLSDGTQRLRAVKGSVGLGARSGGGVVHFGLGPELTVTQAELFRPDGHLLDTLDAPGVSTVSGLGN